MKESNLNFGQFKGNVAIITGAASGIGRAVAYDLLEKGTKIVLVDLNNTNLRDAFKNYNPNQVKLIEADICKKLDREKILEASFEWGGPDYLINSAGVIRVSDIFEVDEEEWDFVQGVNAKACFFLCQLVGQYWKNAEKKGVIVNFSSSAGKMASTPELTAYSVSKASVIALTKSLAYALAPFGTRVNCVCPGLIQTPMQDDLQGGLTTKDEQRFSWEKRLSRIPLQREGTSEEVSKVVLFLLSDSSSYMTGQAINITGGMLMD